MLRAGYDYKTIRQWTVGIEKVDWSGLDQVLIQVLTSKLHELEQVLPAGSLARLRAAVPIMADCITADCNSVAVYHWVGGGLWLSEHREPVYKAGSINIMQTAEFVSLVQDASRYPAAMLHEVAHAYHDRFVAGGINNPVIASAYQSALASGLYEHVMNVSGMMHQANAIQNQMEYFANTTTAYFMKNDDWPMDQTELAETDPVGFQMIRQIWNV